MAFVDLTCKHSFPFRLGRLGLHSAGRLKRFSERSPPPSLSQRASELQQSNPKPGVFQSCRVKRSSLAAVSLVSLLFSQPSCLCESKCVSHGAKRLVSAVYCFRSLLRLVCTEQCKSQEAVCQWMGGGDPRRAGGCLCHRRGAGLWPLGSGKSFHFRETFWSLRTLMGLEYSLPSGNPRLHCPALSITIS